MEISREFWRHCSSCKKQINYKSRYYICSVSTCNRKMAGYVFCSISCWERHLPGARHRDAAAIEEISPTYEEWLHQNSEVEGEERENSMASDNGSAVRRIVVSNGNHSTNDISHDILVVASKLKNYIKVRSGMNTSSSVMDVLSDKLRELCDQAIEKARMDERKTVLERDFE